MIELKVRRVGTSLGVLLPKKMLDAAGVGEGDRIQIPILAARSGQEFYGVWKNDPVVIDYDEDP